MAATLILLGFLTAPLAASVLVEEGAIRRATAMLPFGALLAALGAARIDAIARIPLFRPLARTRRRRGAARRSRLPVVHDREQGRMSETATRVTVIGIIALAMAALAPKVRHGRLLVDPQRARHRRSVRIGRARLSRRVCLPPGAVAAGQYQGRDDAGIEASGRHPGAPIYFTTLRSGRGDWDLKNRYLPPYWRFYATKLGREI